MTGTGSSRQIASTTKNVVGYLATWGRHIPLEGRFHGPSFRNWSGVLTHTPDRIEHPRSENELRDVIRKATQVRCVGAGHSFNVAFAGQTMVGLDRLHGVDVDTAEGTARVKAGTRMRAFNKKLRKKGFALAALPSHDAQSIGGLLATDVHGTGRTLAAFVSEQVRAMRVVDGNGDVHEVGPSDELFRATIGGLGVTGIVTEATFDIVPRFHVQQRTALRDYAEVREKLPELLDEHDHLSLYVFPFARRCQVNTWDRTEADRTRSGTVREAFSISKDAMGSSVAGNLLAYRGLLPRLGDRALRIKNGSDVVLHSHQAFNRSVYHQHEEFEFTTAAEGALDLLDELVERFEASYRRARLPFTVFEVRFTPPGHERTLIGPGRGRDTVWIDVVPNETRDFDTFYREALAFARTHGCRLHLGKWTGDLGPEDLAAVHGPQFAQFLTLRQKFDPSRRFDSPYTAQLFGS